MGSTNLELDLLAKELNSPNYVPCRMKDELIGKKVGEYKCGNLNLQNSYQNGSHWLMYFKSPDLKIAYSSYGDPAPQELIDYLGKDVYTSDIQIQSFDSKACEYYCIAILFLLSKGFKFEDIILSFKVTK